jgi:hypothetical protein
VNVLGTEICENNIGFLVPSETDWNKT